MKEDLSQKPCFLSEFGGNKLPPIETHLYDYPSHKILITLQPVFHVVHYLYNSSLLQPWFTSKRSRLHTSKPKEKTTTFLLMTEALFLVRWKATININTLRLYQPLTPHHPPVAYGIGHDRFMTDELVYSDRHPLDSGEQVAQIFLRFCRGLFWGIRSYL